MNYNRSELIDYSNNKIIELRAKLEEFSGRPYAIVIGGSYARREASLQSDLDYFVIFDQNAARDNLDIDLVQINAKIREVVPKAAAAGGAFEQKECIADMLNNVGGQKDFNDKFTRRILFLIEGEWLCNEELYNDYRCRVIDKYVRNTITDHQLTLFFLNDLIRYYRTVCVDFEFKTFEDGKPWGTRNIKLMFSRKLIYFSGILVCAETAQQTYKDKVKIMKELLALTPIERIQKICGDRAKKALTYYDIFLEQFALEETRMMTDGVTDDRDTHSPEFRRLKNFGHHFSFALSQLIKETYDSTHPIHRALIL